MSKPPLFAFFGTPQESVWALEALEYRGLLPALVVTAPDKPRGRGMELSPCPAKVWALERGIDIITPATLKDPAVLADLCNTDWDVFIVAAYNKLLPKELLDLPRRGCLNIHPSLLPTFRGPSPITSAILEGERATGVSVMQMNEQMDAGPVVAQAKVEISEGERPPQNTVLSEMLFTEGATLLAEVLPEWLAGTLTPEPQDESRATYTKKFGTGDALLDLSGDARENFLKIRAFDKNPRAYFINEKGKRVIVADAQWQGGALEITRVIPEGKKEMFYADYLRGQS